MLRHSALILTPILFDDNPIRITKPQPEILVANAELREGELLNLRWQDVDLEGGTLSVSQQLTRTRKDGLCFTTPKSPRSRRSIKLTRSAVDALKRDKVAQNGETLEAGCPLA